MIDKENRKVVFGDGDVKVAFCEMGIMFGDAAVPDDSVDNIENSYMFGMQLNTYDVPEIDNLLDKIVSGKTDEIVWCDTILKFKKKEDAEEIRTVLAAWCNLIFEETKTLKEYYDTILKGKVNTHGSI